MRDDTTSEIDIRERINRIRMSIRKNDLEANSKEYLKGPEAHGYHTSHISLRHKINPDSVTEITN